MLLAILFYYLMWFCVLVCWYGALYTDFHMSDYLYIPGIDPILLWCMILLSGILLNFASVFVKDISLYFSFLRFFFFFVSFWYYWPHRISWEVFPPVLLFGRIYEVLESWAFLLGNLSIINSISLLVKGLFRFSWCFPGGSEGLSFFQIFFFLNQFW